MKQGINFKFVFPINSIEKVKHSSYSLKLYKDIHNDDFKKVTFEDVIIMKFNGEIEAVLVISESIVEQVIENKKSDGKYYINCYLKDTEVYEILPNIWLSQEHFEVFKNPDYSKLITPKIKLLKLIGTIDV